jgi:hypothetical protein
MPESSPQIITTHSFLVRESLARASEMSQQTASGPHNTVFTILWCLEQNAFFDLLEGQEEQLGLVSALV